MSSQTQKQGKCDRCRVCWTWTLNVPVSRQICLTCNQPLTKVSRKDSAAQRYTWLTWEGYQAPALTRRAS